MIIVIVSHGVEKKIVEVRIRKPEVGYSAPLDCYVRN